VKYCGFYLKDLAENQIFHSFVRFGGAMKALFLGAGASYEVGMPLVWEFTNVLRSVVLKQIDSKLFNFEKQPELKSYLIGLFKNQNLHYEEMVSELENLYLQSRNEPSKRDTIHGLVVRLTEIIQLLLLEDQVKTIKLLAERIKHYYGLCNYISQDEPTFVYSLNHDVVFEEVCSFLRIPLSDGFYDEPKKLSNVAPFASISTSQLESGNLNFFQSSEAGVNLIKLHGSLDIFAIEDLDYFIKARGNGTDIGSHLEAILSAEKENRRVCARDQYRITNELTVEDEDGVIQFLRRSLLSGGHKFKREMSQIAPIAYLNIFKESILSINELTVVGYSFGDSHINTVLTEWLAEKDKTVIIFDPYMKDVPECIKAFGNKVAIHNGGFSDFCLQWDSSKESFSTTSMREALDVFRKGLKERREQQT
jgi:hypothetical protein